ncbi:MAG: hypothetical protein WD266_10175 [Balneolales bacterium]
MNKISIILDAGLMAWKLIVVSAHLIALQLSAMFTPSSDRFILVNIPGW